jgi:hypothetical protein
MRKVHGNRAPLLLANVIFQSQLAQRGLVLSVDGFETRPSGDTSTDTCGQRAFVMLLRFQR